jgi:hypothetical protein
MGGTLAILTGSHFLFRAEGIRRNAHLGSIAFSVVVGMVGAVALYSGARLICELIYGAELAPLAAHSLRIASGLLPLFFAVLVVQLPLQAHVSNRYQLMRGIGTFAVSLLVGWSMVRLGQFELISLGAYAGFSCALLADSARLISFGNKFYAS